MRVSLSLQAIALFALGLANSARADQSSDVVDLSKDTFSKFLETEQLSLVEFFAPWCGHCKALAPEYEIAATALKGVVPIAKVDCTVETDVCESQNVRGYPTLKIFRDGKPADYKGARKADSIISYMKKQTLPAISNVSAENLEEFSTREKVVIVGFFAEESGDEYSAFAKVAETFREDYLFGFITDAEAAKANGIESSSGIILYKKFDEGKIVFGESITVESVTDFVKVNALPTIDEIGPENYSEYIDRGIPIAYLFYGSEDDKKAAGAQVEAVAVQHKGKISFVYIDGVKYGGHGSNLNLKAEWPAFVIQDPAKNLKYPFDQSKEIAKEGLAEFVQSYLDGKLEPSIKSAPVPESDEGLVKVIVGSTYEKIVLDSSKDVFIELYAPWCGHCKKLAPIWDELAEKVAENKNLIIAKMDATENDIPPASPFRVEGFPTLKLYKSNSNEIVDYTGERNVDSFLSFLKQHTSTPVDTPAEQEGHSHDEL